MRRINPTASGVSRAAAVVLGVALALVFWATAASAQQSSAGVQYGVLTPPSGPAAGAKCSSLKSDNGLLDAGDTVTFPGNFVVSQGSSVVLEDGDKTQGTLVDGKNAKINGKGAINVTVTGPPQNVVGGNGVMNDTVCNSVVATTGVSAGDSANDEGAILSVLPDTSGSLVVLLGAVALAGTGLAILRRRAARS